MTAPFKKAFGQVSLSPWETQRSLMAASDQMMPSKPELNKGALLYAALSLEEGSEILTGLTRALERLVDGAPAKSPMRKMLLTLNNHMDEAGTSMYEHSLAIRAQLSEMPNDFRADLTDDEVVEIADGTTDLTVTNCGFALSMGLDGDACYAEVAGSNLSKRNPKTGKIDKKPDGKWIRGEEFREPSLHAVIFANQPKA